MLPGGTDMTKRRRNENYLLSFVFLASLLSPAALAATPEAWWRSAVLYHIYPRSFQDSNGDGVGDLKGITSRLEYLASLGVDGLWLSPVYPSPHYDHGYDIADYYGVDPLFGTSADLEELIAEAHRRGLKIVLDMVLNHTSHLHPWFQGAVKGNKTPTRDFYVWRKGRGKHGELPPNNWITSFGERAWTREAQSGEWYYHQFSRFQPDLNYTNPAVEAAMFSVFDHWIAKGVDGFRLDVIGALFEDPDFPDNPRCLQGPPSDLNMRWLFQEHRYDWNRPETLRLVQRLRAHVEGLDPRVLLLGETLGPPETVRSFYGQQGDGLHLAFNFSLASHSISKTPYRARAFAERIARIETTLPDPLWPCYAFSNHDRSRIISQHGGDRAKAMLLSFVLLTLRGTPVLYYGEELGMRNVRVPRARLQDPLGKKFWPLPVSRDAGRTPMQWNETPGAGFSTADPNRFWLPLSPDAGLINVVRQLEEDTSLLRFHADLLALRREQLALSGGSLRLLPLSNSEVLAYVRSEANDHRLILAHFGARTTEVALQELPSLSELLFHSNGVAPYILHGNLRLGPHQGAIYSIDP